MNVMGGVSAGSDASAVVDSKESVWIERWRLRWWAATWARADSGSGSDAAAGKEVGVGSLRKQEYSNTQERVDRQRS